MHFMFVVLGRCFIALVRSHSRPTHIPISEQLKRKIRYMYTHTHQEGLNLAVKANNDSTSSFTKDVQPISSGMVWWCRSLQLSVQTVHHKQEVDFKHCKKEHPV
jgi:hypothetical protein